MKKSKATTTTTTTTITKTIKTKVQYSETILKRCFKLAKENEVERITKEADSEGISKEKKERLLKEIEIIKSIPIKELINRAVNNEKVGQDDDREAMIERIMSLELVVNNLKREGLIKGDNDEDNHEEEEDFGDFADFFTFEDKAVKKRGRGRIESDSESEGEESEGEVRYDDDQEEEGDDGVVVVEDLAEDDELNEEQEEKKEVSTKTKKRKGTVTGREASSLFINSLSSLSKPNAKKLKEKKNRAGQQARRAKNYQMFGDNAKHITLGKQNGEQDNNTNNNNYNHNNNGKPEKRKMKSIEFSEEKGAKPTKHSYSAKPKPNLNQEELHPSWVAKQNAKNKGAIQSFVGKKISFGEENE